MNDSGKNPAGPSFQLFYERCFVDPCFVIRLSQPPFARPDFDRRSDFYKYQILKAEWTFSKISLLKKQAIIKAQSFGLLSVKLTDRVNDEIALHPPFDSGA